MPPLPNRRCFRYSGELFISWRCAIHFEEFEALNRS
jgi:hypothetical protein